MSNISIRPIDWTLSGAIIPSQSWPGSDGNDGALYVPQSSKTPLYRCSQRILQPQPTELTEFHEIKHLLIATEQSFQKIIS